MGRGVERGRLVIGGEREKPDALAGSSRLRDKGEEVEGEFVIGGGGEG